jgi:hypothetical protein
MSIFFRSIGKKDVHKKRRNDVASSRTEGEGHDEVVRRVLLVLVGAPQILLDSCVGGAGVDEGQARVGGSQRRLGCPMS